MVRICEICDAEYDANKSNQRYCPDCGKDPEKARRGYMIAEMRSKRHAGDKHPVREYTCKVCGKKTLSTYNRTFCSNACLQLQIVHTAKCPVCGVLLVSRGRMSGKGCCSDECSEKQKIQSAIANGRYKPCQQCGKMFIEKREGGKFCSLPCYREWVNAERAEKQKPKPADFVFEKRCRGCGKVFTYTKQNSSKLYCSKECRIAKVKAGVKAMGKLKQDKLKQDKHLCLSCKTSQAHCERFTSHFSYLPRGAVQKVIKGKAVVTACPKFK